MVQYDGIEQVQRSAKTPVSLRCSVAANLRQHELPTTYAVREYVEADGLISYGIDYRQVGVYVGRVLMGAKLPSSVAGRPVVQLIGQRLE